MYEEFTIRIQVLIVCKYISILLQLHDTLNTTYND